MAAIKPGDARVKPFAEWLAKRLTSVDKTLLQNMADTVGFKSWTVFEQPIVKHIGEYSRETEGVYLLKRREQYQVAAEDIIQLVMSGVLTFPGVDFTSAIKAHEQYLAAKIGV